MSVNYSQLPLPAHYNPARVGARIERVEVVSPFDLVITHLHPPSPEGARLYLVSRGGGPQANHAA